MRWFKAEIRGNGYQVDAGAAIPDKKVVHYVFQAASNAEARQKARDFATGPVARKEFWLYDSNPDITVTAFLEGDEPTEERYWSAD